MRTGQRINQSMPKPTATAAAGRRLSDLLQEQQEPFLQHHSAATATASGRTLLCLLCGGSNAAAKPQQRQRWGRLAGCFPCAAPASRQRFRRLPRAGAGAGAEDDAAMADGGSTQLSPVSVMDLELDLRSDDDESPDHCNSPSPPPPPSSLGLTAGAHGAIVGTGGDQRKHCGALSLSTLLDKEQAVVSAWERIAADISRIPALVALDLSGSGSNWRRRLAGEEEARRQLVQSIEAMIFEEVRWEAVRDIILLHVLHSTDFSS